MKKRPMKSSFIFLVLCFFSPWNEVSFAQIPVMDACPASIDFSHTLRKWDGFGFNYVETAQTPDYKANPQDYGGFKYLSEKQKREIIDLVFGQEGLQVSLIKMFLDPFHQDYAGGKFDHRLSASNMLFFVEEGLKTTRNRGADLEIITTLYGPPAYVTLQNFMRGRDLHPERKIDLANYMMDWVKFLKEEGFPVKYLSLHNEGEDWERWPRDGKSGNMENGHDYNMFWSPQLVAEYLNFMPSLMKKAGLDDVKMTNGEPSNWYRFSTWGYPEAIVNDPKALKNLGLITSHGFWYPNWENRWYADHKSAGIDLIRSKRPELHAWVTSTSWSKMDSRFIQEIHANIYSAKVNAIIPWAGIQLQPLWIGYDPNPGCAFVVRKDSTYEVTNGYYFYKQVCRAGYPGMDVAETWALDSELPIIAFASGKTKYKNAFVVINTSHETDKTIQIEIKGSQAVRYQAFRTNGANEKYKEIGSFQLQNGTLRYDAPKGTVTTFFALD